MRYLRNAASAAGTTSLEFLDLGIGMGSFGRRIKTEIIAKTNLVGVEVWEKYRNPRWDFYDSIVMANILDFLDTDQRHFDFILLIDVLEHFDRATGLDLLSTLKLKVRRTLIVSTPLTKYPQGEFGGNPYEKHRSTWSEADLEGAGLRQIFRTWSLTLSLWPPVAKLGVAVYERS